MTSKTDSDLNDRFKLILDLLSPGTLSAISPGDRQASSFSHPYSTEQPQKQWGKHYLYSIASPELFSILYGTLVYDLYIGIDWGQTAPRSVREMIKLRILIEADKGKTTNVCFYTI